MSWIIDTEHQKREVRKEYGKTLEKLIEKGMPLMVCDADLASSSGAGYLFEKYPEHTVNFGVCEANMISAAAAMSRVGLRPFVHSFSPFVSRRVLDQIYMSVAFADQDIHIYASDPGYWSLHNGPTHATFEDIAAVRAIPNICVVAPADAISFAWVLEWYAEHGGRIYNRCTRKIVPSIYREGSEFCYGKGQVVREGREIAFIAIGAAVYDALECANILSEKGLSCTVVDLFFIKPLDEELIDRIIHEHKIIITVENHSIYGGIGEIVGARMAESSTKGILRRIGVRDQFNEVGSKDYLKAKFKLTVHDILETVEEAIKEQEKA